MSLSAGFDPEDAPIVQVHSHLPAVAAARLQPSALRERFLAPPAWMPEPPALRRTPTAGPAVPASRVAAVLVPLVDRGGVTVLFTRRTEGLAHHPGQISFPGGRVEPGDADAASTALREAQEEIGLDPRHVQVLGSLPVLDTSTGFAVTPVVGLMDAAAPLALDRREVAEVFEVPLSFLMDPAHHRLHAIDWEGQRREFWSMPWQDPATARRQFIWGATAAMLRNLYRLLAA